MTSPARRTPARLVAGIALTGALLTAAASWAAWRTNRGNEHRLLVLQTRQAASVISSAIIGIVGPLQTALQTARATDGDPAAFRAYVNDHVGPNALFVSAALWRTDGAAPVPLVSVGGAPELAPGSAAARAFVSRATRSTSFVVTSITTGPLPRIGYALAVPTDHRFAVYAERAIPANRRVAVERGSAFADLHFATYLGPTTRTSAMQTADVALDQLPLRGNTVRETIPFGDTVLTLVAAPVRPLGGGLGTNLPWILIVGGVAVTVAAMVVAAQLARQRRSAERDTATIAGLYGELDGLYGEQRTISETLQHALLPRSNPTIPHLEIASRYVAGAHGVDIGGDWYSVIRLDGDRFGFVVGDVSGRGVDAAALMARIRFTLRAYLVEGHDPREALELCSRQVDVDADGHIVTVLVGTGELSTRRVTLANAGHPSPLLVSAGEARYAVTAAGPPLGVRGGTYPLTTLDMPAGSMLIAFTDGLIERRTENLDTGLRRLADVAAPATGPVDAVLTGLLSSLCSDGSEDDVAILAFRWDG